MSRRKEQARIRLHQKRIALGLSMTALAELVKRPRESVSRAVNHGAHPQILVRVKEVLNAR